MNGRPSSPDERGSPPTGLDPGRSNFNEWWKSTGVNEVLNNIRAHLSSPPTPRPQAPSGDLLPRLQVYNDLASRPAMPQHEVVILSRELETVLKQVQSVVRGMGLEPIQLSDVEIIPRRTEPVYSRRGLPVYSRRGLSSMFPEIVKPAKSNLEGLNKEQQDKALQVLEKHSHDVKVGITEGISQQEMSEEYGAKLHAMVDCLEKNLKLALQSRPSSFSIAGLKRMIPEGTQKWFERVSKYITFAQVAITIAGSTYDAIGTSPVHFGTIGNESKSILNDDFTLEKIKLNSDPANNFSAGVGAQRLGQQLLSQLMIKLKHENTSVSCNVLYETETEDPNAEGQIDPIIQAIANAHNGPAQDNDIAAVRISVNKLMGYDLKSTFLIPYPSLHGKFEIKGFIPYVSYGACAQLVPSPAGVGLNRNPLLGISGVFGVENSGLGLQFQYDAAAADAEKHFVPSVGLFVRTELLAAGLTYKHRPGIYSASVVKKLVDTTTAVGLKASYSHEDNDNGGARFGVGVKHAVDPTMFGKVKVATDCASLAVKKSFHDGLFSVKALAHVDFNTPWRLPKFGILFSFCRPSCEKSKKKN